MKFTPHNNQLKHSARALQKALTLSAVFLLAIVSQSKSSMANITNTAQAFGTYATSSIGSNLSTQAVPVVSANPSLEVTKTPSITSGAVAGQTITYTYTVKNNGNVTISTISLLDSHNAAGPTPIPGSVFISIAVSPGIGSHDAITTDAIWDSLAPGDTITFTANYIVKQSDVDTLQ